MNINIFLFLRFSSLNNFHRGARKNVRLVENQIYKTHLRFRPFSLISNDQRKKHCEHSVWLFFEATPLTLTAIDVNQIPLARSKRRSTHVPNLTDELSTAEERRLNQFGSAG